MDDEVAKRIAAVSDAAREEVAQFRAHIESLFNRLVWAIGIVAAVAGGAFVYFFHGTASEMQDFIRSNVDERIIDHRINSDVRKRLEEKVTLEIEAAGPKLDQAVASALEKRVEQDAQRLFAEQVSKRVGELTASDLTQEILRIPIATVLSSAIAPKEFDKLVGNPDVFDAKKTTWALADGRDVSGSKFSVLTGKSAIPDLRGMFLRGLNVGRADGKEDPDGEARDPWIDQGDEIRSHTHTITAASGIDGNRSGQQDALYGAHPSQTGPTGGKETRPKNMAVYFYLRIN